MCCFWCNSPAKCPKTLVSPTSKARICHFCCRLELGTDFFSLFFFGKVEKRAFGSSQVCPLIGFQLMPVICAIFFFTVPPNAPNFLSLHIQNTFWHSTRNTHSRHFILFTFVRVWSHPSIHLSSLLSHIHIHNQSSFIYFNFQSISRNRLVWKSVRRNLYQAERQIASMNYILSLHNVWIFHL